MTTVYRIVNKDTQHICGGVTWRETIGRGKKRVPGGYEIWWQSADTAPYCNIKSINYQIEHIIRRGLMSLLDNCEIKAYEQKYTPVKSAVKLENTRNRLEQRVLMEKLKI